MEDKRYWNEKASGWRRRSKVSEVDKRWKGQKNNIKSKSLFFLNKIERNRRKRRKNNDNDKTEENKEKN